MTIWALLLTLAYIPNWTGWAMQSGWAFILLTVPWMVRGPHLPRVTARLGLAFLGWALLSCFALHRPQFGGEQILQLVAIGLVILLSSGLPDLRKAVRGLAIGLTIGTLAAAWYAFGWASPYHGIIPTIGKPAGFLYNNVIFGDACAFTILLLLSYRSYWLLPGLAFGLFLSDSRGAALALVLGIVCWIGQERKWVLGLLAAIAVPAAIALHLHGVSDTMRLNVWHYVWSQLSWWPHGPGRLEEIGFLWQGRILVIEYAHNEWLNLAYEYGIGGIIPIALLLAPLTQFRRAEWPAYCAFTATCLWSFPLHYPVEASIGALVAGQLYRNFSLSWRSMLAWRPRLPAWDRDWKLQLNPARWGYLPLQPSLMEKRTP